MLKVDYILLNNMVSLQAVELWQAKRDKVAAPEKVYVIQDQVIPPNSEESSAAQRRLAAFAKAQHTPYFYGSTMASHFLTQEVVKPGDIVLANDADVFMIGAKGALGLVVDAQATSDALCSFCLKDEKLAATDVREVLASYNDIVKVEIVGTLAETLDMRSVGIALHELLRNIVQNSTIIVFADKTKGLKLEEKMLICGWCQRLEIKSALFLEAGLTVTEREKINFSLDSVVRGYAKHEQLALAGQEVVAVYIGGSHGGFLEDIKLVAEMVAGKHFACKVRLSIAPASSEIYYLAATAGYLTTIMEAGGLILNQCALPPVQARIGAGEILVSNDVHNEEDYAGKGGRIVLTDTRTAVNIALCGRLEGVYKLDNLQKF